MLLVCEVEAANERGRGLTVRKVEGRERGELRSGVEERRVEVGCRVVSMLRAEFAPAGYVKLTGDERERRGN